MILLYGNKCMFQNMQNTIVSFFYKCSCNDLLIWNFKCKNDLLSNGIGHYLSG